MCYVDQIKNTGHPKRCGCLYCKETSPSKRSKDFKHVHKKNNEPLKQLLHHITHCENISHAIEKNSKLPSRKKVIINIRKAIKLDGKKIQQLRKEGWIRD